MTPDIIWAFSLGHGHAAQFENFRESCPPDLKHRSYWAGMSFIDSGDRLAKLPFLPRGLRSRRHEMWHLKQALRQRSDRTVLFLASWNLRLLPLMWRYPSFLYVDFSPSLMRSLSPWYDHFFKWGLLQALRDSAASLLPRAATRIITMSRWAAQGITADYHLDPARVHAVLPGASLPSWHFTDRSRREGNPRRILMVGGEFQRKGGESLLRWAETTKVRDVAIDIVTWPGQLPANVRAILGDLPPDGRLSKSLAPWLPNVTIHCGLFANTPELKAFYDRADIFCLPTHADFSTIASLEAMAKGLPVITGKVGGIPELIDEGRTGYCIAPGDAKALGERLEMLLEDRLLRLRIGRAARDECEARLNVSRQMRQIASVIDHGRVDP